ncbi:succinate dehydrogenase cytochrome b subunit [Chitinophaga sp. sic0106]|uniref:succinate dehydrogenase cytochrome b subunit n=1 Tax=Chitinophaga sp. sic0106 TaxID=2854785 RepID=UPI001C4563F4|nr:succinate dehydrogenase cytochrome b subunit [Chitinophaga sp. sic0106]MBV7528787.1 succinate dehydrogenase cytochrome b subunit [Chitinophaga sp. sic0106]
MTQTTLTRKIWMALTGLFLCFFLVIHLLGNLQLLLPGETSQLQFNAYSHLLSGNILIKIVSWVLYASIIAHVIYAIIITVANTRARQQQYHYDRRGSVSKWYSRNMGLLGTIIFIFLVIHFRDFWYVYKFGQLPLDAQGNKDLYTLVTEVYSQTWYVGVYVLCMVALCYHLLHGFFSAARTLGAYHPKYVRWIKVLGWVYSVGICAGFAFIPVYVHFLK